VRHDLFEAPAGTGEVVEVGLRKLKVDPQAIELRVDATGQRLDVYAVLVSSNSNALRRFHYFFNVAFTDGETGDDGLEIIGSPIGWVESVIFTDSGLEVTIPFHWGDDEEVIFTEDAFSVAYSIHNNEYVTFADYAIKYVLDFLATEQVRFSDISVACTSGTRLSLSTRR
jgi:hypothetical protein